MSKTPMMVQFEEIKAKHPNSILFYRVGDFYEMFHDDAKLAAEKLDLTLTARGKADGMDIPLAGVPYHAADQYIGRLVRQGFSVAVCDQVEDPKQAKGIVRREVTRVVTPGTLMEEDLLDARSNNFLVAICERGSRLGLAWVDVSTADFFAEEFTGSDSMDELMSELLMIEPKEILLAESMMDDEEFLLRIRALLGEQILFRPFAVEYNLNEAITILLEEFQLLSLDGFGMADFTLGVVASAQALDFVRSTQRSGHSRLLKIIPRRRSSYMLLDPTTRSNLELTRTIRDHDERGTLFSVLNRTKTAMGTRLLREWLHQPLVDQQMIEDRQNQIEALVNNRILLEELMKLLRDIYDLERLVSRLTFGSAGARELRMLSRSLVRVGEIRARIKTEKEFQPLLNSLFHFPEIIELIDRAIIENPPFTVREGGMIKEGYDQSLDELRKIKTGGSEWMVQLAEQEKERTGIKTLKVKYNRVFGYYIEVTKMNIHLVPENYIRKQTLANAERYFTPELKEMESQILGASDRMSQIEFELFNEIREKAVLISESLLITAKSVASLDVLVSLALAAVEHNYVRPVINKDDILEIIDGRHPVVEQMDNVSFIPNNTQLTEDSRLQIITGPNMAGKSTYIRQVALIVLMAQIGSFIPARSARIGLVDRIFTRVGASDNLYRGQSTFMVEMVETANILNNATRNSLIILDEIGRGTSTFDGISIAWALAEYLSRGPRRICGARTLFATHYHELTRLEGELPATKNYNVAVVEEDGEILFLRKIVPGGADQSYGIHVASLAGIPGKVIQKARKILSVLEKTEASRSMGKATVLEDLDQLDLFAEPVEEKETELTLKVRGLDPDSLTPRQAHDFLYELKELLED